MSSYWLKHIKKLGLALLLAWLVCLSVFAQQADAFAKQQEQEPPPKPILDAPSLRIPAMLAYETTFKELGFENAEQLLAYSLQEQINMNLLGFDGGVLAMGSLNGTVTLWNVQSGEPTKALQAQGRIVSGAFAGDILATGADGTVNLWNMQSGKLIKTLQVHNDIITEVAFDGSMLAAGSWNGTVTLWNAHSNELIKIFQTKSKVSSVSFDGKGILASASEDGTVKLWEVKSGALIRTLQAHTQGSNSVAFDGNGLLATGSLNGTVKLWKVQSGELLNTLQAESVSSVAFDGKGLLASGSLNGMVLLWDVSSGTLKQTLQTQSLVHSLSFNRQGLLAAGSSHEVVKILLTDDILKQTLQGQSAIDSLSFNGNDLLVSGSRDGTLKLWEVSTGELKQTLQSHEAQGYSNTIARFLEEDLLASSAADGKIKLWQVSTRQLLATLYTGDYVVSMDFDGKGLLVTAESIGKVKLWDLRKGLLPQTLQAGKLSSHSVAIDGKGLLATNSLDGMVQLWEVGSGTLKHTLQVQDDANLLACDGAGTLVVSGMNDGTVQLWDVGSGALKQTLQAQSQVVSVAFDGKGLLATGSLDGMVRLWEVLSGALLHTLQAHDYSVRSVAFDGKGLLASGSEDGTVKLWKVGSGALKQTSLATGQGAWVTIKADGSVLRADAGKILRQGSILAEGEYTVETPEKDKDAKPTGNILKEQQTYQTVKWSYLPFPSSQTNSLAISLDKTLVDASADKADFFTLQLTNTSAEPIFHPKILETTSADGSLKIIQAEYLPTYPQTEAIYSSTNLIPAGKTIKLAARVIGNTPKPVASGEYEIPVTVEVSGGQTKTVPLKVNYQTPDVQVLSSDFSRDTNTLSIQLKNQGTLALPKADFYLKDAEGKLNLPRQTLEGIAAQTDAPPLAFTLPKDLPQEQLDKLQLEIRPMRPPLYTEWTIPLTLTVMPMHTQLGLAALALVLLGFTVFYFRRYRHPLVLELGEQPQQLRQLPLEQLPETQQRLKQTGRLSTVLENAEVSAQTFQQALGFAQWSSEQKAQYLAERLCGSLEGTPLSLPLSGEEFAPSFDKGRAGVGLDLYTLKLPNHFPLNVHRVLLYFPAVPVEDTFNELRALPQAEGRITLIIGSDAAYQRKLLNTTQDRSNKYVAPQSKQLTELLLSPQAEPVFAKILAEQLALQQLSPYQIGGGVNKEAIFFGRRELIAQIINRDPANYLIVGGRQMGKSSLLKALERRYTEHAQVRVYYQPLSNATLIPRLAAALDLSESNSPQAFAQALEARLKAEGKRYIFLIDEADLFIAHEQAQGYPILSVFRRLSEQGQCSFILAGFWQLYQHAVLDYQSPLRNFGEVLEVGALEQDACEQLATKPMQNLNLSYANHALVQHLIRQCGQRANLIADVCDQVIKQLNASQRVIEAGDIHRVLESRDLQKRLAGWSVGMGEQEQAYDRLVVYSTIQKDGFTLGELMQDLEQQGVKFSSVELERALSRLELAFVLKKIQSRYRYCVPLFVNYMHEDEVENKRVRELKAWI